MLMTIPKSVEKFNEFLTKLKQDLLHHVVLGIENQLEKDVEGWLYRSHHERREGVRRQTQARCQRCGSQKAQDFSRNGRRQRQLVTCYGVLSFWLPRVICECGGSVTIPFSIIQPYQRIWDDVMAQIDRWATLGLSLRQMQAEVGEQLGTQIGLRKFNETVHNVKRITARQLTSVPPIIMLDAIWVTLLQDTDDTQKDSLGRERQVKKRYKVCVLVALGLYPQNGRWGILGWHVADSESKEAWEALLISIENRGVYRQRGLELLIHDGGKGLIAALDLMYPHIPHQRCTFHKLRNPWHSIQTPKQLSTDEKRAFKLELIQHIQPILYASDKLTAKRLRDYICQQFKDTQPDFVATLLRDWDDTVAFYKVLNRFPQWRRTALRTTSLLERLNRMLRRLFRPAGAFHSLGGLFAAISRVLNPKWLF